jgi:hypothetical protein
MYGCYENSNNGREALSYAPMMVDVSSKVESGSWESPKRRSTTTVLMRSWVHREEGVAPEI